MRVTVTIDGDVLAAAKALASRRGSSLGSALSELARRGYSNLTPVRKGGDDTVFAVRADAEAITSEDVDRALADWP
ncbi:MAG: antitoxin [Holophagales bacterium]|nr:antitoxin [Acidobacteriota bacterium]MYA07302.1 antitoxin [Holophagales bacterium]MYG29423.1 antitoxin [Holophagales bacterium]MYI80059.1 antitoxin [Holophagales bacterium]